MIKATFKMNWNPSTNLSDEEKKGLEIEMLSILCPPMAIDRLIKENKMLKKKIKEA